VSPSESEDAASVPVGPGHVGGRGSVARLLGPAFVAAIAYVDPGNIAANLTAGAQYGYLLLWVLVLANVMAMLVQYLSAKLGAVTGKTVADLLGDSMGTRGRILFFLQAEASAIATDIAEVVGGAIALQILFGLPLLLGGVIVGIVSIGLLAVQTRRGQRPFEHVVMGLLGVITIGFLAGLVVSPPDGKELASGLVPRFDGTHTVVLAASMLGATVMPHAIYLHAGLVRDHHGGGGAPGRIRRLLTASRWDVLASLALAGTVNIAMLVLAAEALPGVPGTDTIQGAHHAIEAATGPVVGVLFGIGLLASGLASSSVGAYAGAEIMHGLLKVRVPLIACRVITLVPALVVLAVGADPTASLVISQVVLSLCIPFALVPLVVLTSSRSLMGAFTNPVPMRVVAWVVAAAIIVLNVALVVLTLMGEA
jgi:manganese transport protein